MSPYLKSAAVMAIIAVLYAVAQIAKGTMLVWTKSGGLGAVSFGLSELLIAFTTTTVIVWAVIYWRSRRNSATRR